MSHFLDAEIVGLAGKTEPTRISFDRHVNIIYGLNGSGKTSLLRILHSAMKMQTSQLRNVPFTEATVRMHSLSFNTDFTFKIKKSDLGPTQGVQLTKAPFEPAWEVGQVYEGTVEKKPANWKMTPARPDKSEVPFASIYLPTSRLHVGAGQGLTNQRTSEALTEDLLDRYFADAVSALWSQYSAEVVRAVRDAQEKGLASILRGVLAGSGTTTRQAQALDLESGYDSAKKFLQRQGSPSALGSFEHFKKRFAGDKSLQNVVNDIFQIEQAIDNAVAPQRQLEGLIRKMYSGNKTVSFGDKSIVVADPGGKEIGLASLSSGEKHLIQLFVATLLAKESSILIDEPEISIHVDWQRELVPAFQMLNPEAQFILATHSPEVMADISDDRIFSL